MRTSFTFAKLVEKTNLYDEIIDAMKKMVKPDFELTTEERNLLSMGYKKMIGRSKES
jgi:14-3-3 protein epsilon